MPNGGHVIIETRRVSALDVADASTEDLTSPIYAMLAVSDTGCGMNDDVRSHLFEPFFTTKEADKEPAWASQRSMAL